jgi:hypothetical protein
MEIQANAQWHSIVSSMKKAMATVEGISAWVPICDVSGSMGSLTEKEDDIEGLADNPDPINISIALSLLLASVNTVESGFYGKIFTFDHEPSLVTVMGNKMSTKIANIGQLVDQVHRGDSGGSTNIDATMDLFLKHSKKIGTSEADMAR